MNRLLPSTFLFGALLLSGCAGAAIRWRPSLASQVPDSTTVRFRVRPGEAPIAGRALDWQRGRPRVITARGDTVAAPEGATLDVRVPEKARHEVAGGIIGWAVGVGISYATCPAPKRYCGEEDPTPLLAMTLGALIGLMVKTDRWVAVRWDAP